MSNDLEKGPPDPARVKFNQAVTDRLVAMFEDIDTGKIKVHIADGYYTHIDVMQRFKVDRETGALTLIPIPKGEESRPKT